ncbi:MAG: hypothetical protein JSR39_01695 [Verrucomicrobia bacterium]|nr:hypothetical protein [Verrucomicrobiota bacterium]
MTHSIVPKRSPELNRLAPELPCIYDFIEVDEILLAIFFTAICTSGTPREAALIWKRLSLVDCTFHRLAQDLRINDALVRSKVEIPTRHLIHRMPKNGSEQVIEEAWNAKQQRMVSQFWNSKNYDFYSQWLTGLPIDVRSMMTSIDLTTSRKSTERRSLEQLTCIAAKMPLLDKLVLRRCSFADDRCLEWISIEVPCLRILDLHSCYRITNRGMIALMRHAQHLEELNLTSCKQIGFDGFSAIGLFGVNIRKLHLGDTKMCHYKLQQILVPRGEQLELLDLSQCTFLGVESITLVATYCKNLKTLTLEACVGINERCLFALSQGCPKLESISLSISPNLSYRGVQALLLSKSRLQNLSIHYCCFTEEECQSLEQEFPLVKIHWRRNFLLPSSSRSL